MKAFPLVQDLVADVSRNYEIAKMIPPFTPKETEDHIWRFLQVDVDRSREKREFIECFLCQDVYHVVREHKRDYIGPPFHREDSISRHASSGQGEPGQLSA